MRAHPDDGGHESEHGDASSSNKLSKVPPERRPLPTDRETDTSAAAGTTVAAFKQCCSMLYIQLHSPHASVQQGGEFTPSSPLHSHTWSTTSTTPAFARKSASDPPHTSPFPKPVIITFEAVYMRANQQHSVR